MRTDEKKCKTDVVLASASPRRRELLAQIGVEFRVVVSEVEERVETDVPWQVVEALSDQKAEAVWNHLDQQEMGSRLLIGADTIVACGDQILGKPRDEAQAALMLRQLQGRSHEVYTGVTLLYRGEDGAKQSKTFHEMTKVHFYPMTDTEIQAYVATGDPLDKAGAYGIQGLCARYIRGIDGDYNNVVGLPVGRLYQEAGEWWNI